MRNPLPAFQLEEKMERLKDKFREKMAHDFVETAEIIMGLAAHIQRLENVLRIVGHPDNPKSATLTVDTSSIIMKPTSIEIKCNDILLSGSHNVVIQAEGNLTIKAASRLTVNGLRVLQTGAGATLDGGEIHLKGGQEITLKAHKVNITADSDLRLKGSKILEN